MKDIAFGDIPVKGEFECYGDYYLNYDYPKICKCRKLLENVAEEIDGIKFSMDPFDIVSVEE